jgi:uncharacterized protein YndB with AHSA1/START domain
MKAMGALKKIQLEYGLKTTPKLLYTAISTPEGLSRWFADMVLVEDDVFHFIWEGSDQKARMLKCRDNECVYLHWLDDPVREEYLEMHITNEPVSSEVALVIIDYAEEQDMDFTQRLWDAQVKKLQRLFNS